MSVGIFNSEDQSLVKLASNSITADETIETLNDVKVSVATDKASVAADKATVSADKADIVSMKSQISNTKTSIDETAQTISENADSVKQQKIAIDETKTDIDKKYTEISNTATKLNTEYNNLTSNYYTKEATNSLISSTTKPKYSVVNELPTSDISTDIIYLKSTNTTSTDGIYEMYTYQDSNWVKIGTSNPDLADYYTKELADSTFATKEEINNTNTKVSELRKDLTEIIDKSVNILNPKNITYGRLYTYKEVNGKYMIDSSPREGYACAFVDVKENNKYIISGVSYNCFGTSDDGEILSYCSRIDIGDKDTPNAIIEPSYRSSAWTAEGVVTRVYFSWRTNVYDNVMVAKGEVLPQAYVPFKKELLSDIDIDISQIKNLQESHLSITLNDVASKMKKMTKLTKEIVLPTIFNDSYIDVTTKKIGSFSNWCVRTINLNKGDKLTATINGSNCCLATCIDKTPTLSSKFDIILKFVVQNGYKFEFIAEKDETIYISTQNAYANTGILTTVNVVNINSINEKVDVLSKKMDKNTEMGKLASFGYSLDYNKALEVIEAFNYGGDNPWTKLENADDFESFGTYIDNKIESIPNGSSFIFITDVHYTGNQKHSGALIDYIRRRANIKTIIHGGDVQNERPLAIDAAKDWFDFNKDYVGRIGSDFKQVCGDHDHNGQFWGKEELRKQYNLTDASKTFFTCNFVQKVLTGYCENEIVFDTVYDDSVKGYGWSEEDLKEYNAFKKMHYYFDDNTINTRFIVLFTGWNWQQYGFPYNKCGVGGALPTQMDFLYNALMTVNDKYNVIVLGHDTIINPHKETVGGKQYYDTGETVYNSRAWKCVSDMLSAMKMKTSTTAKYSDWSKPYEQFDSFPSKVYDFTNSPNVNVCMTIGGDVHWDILSKTTTDDSQTIKTLHSGDYINISTDIPHIVTMTDGSDRGYCDYTTRETICKPATKGTIDEQAFDVVTINDTGIYITRIGSGDDRKLLFN